jgi:hypothetical protein
MSKAEHLAAGAFCLPEHISSVSLSFTDDKRLRGSIKGMKTTLFRAGFQSAAELIEETDDGLLPSRLKALEEYILQKMRDYLEHPDTKKLPEIFHSVQLWGGKTGRFIYTRGGGFAQNYDGPAYEEFAGWAANRSACQLGERISALRSASERIGYFGVAFGTKHARFWSQAAGAPPLPIYDRLLAQGAFGFKMPSWLHYPAYVDEMTHLAGLLDLDVYQLERRAFVFFASPDGRAWTLDRLRRREINL